MARWTFHIAILALLAAGLGAAAQPRAPMESVTVTGTRSHQVIENFVASLAAPARLTGKIARWEDGVCPLTVGLRPGAAKFITQRVRSIAAMVGAPVNNSAACKPNIEIVFTTKPQALLDNIARKQEVFLGYADTSAQRKTLATVTRPIQAWYTTATKDLRGQEEVDNAKGGGAELAISDSQNPGSIVTMAMPYAHGRNITGSRLGDGLRSTFYHIIIVADPSKLVDYEIGTLADYIALLALTQLHAPDTCQQLSSIVNLLAPDCEPKTNALTDNDIGYLRGLYKMSPDRTLRVQQDEVAYQMGQALDGR